MTSGVGEQQITVRVPHQQRVATESDAGSSTLAPDSDLINANHPAVNTHFSIRRAKSVKLCDLEAKAGCNQSAGTTHLGARKPGDDLPTADRPNVWQSISRRSAEPERCYCSLRALQYCARAR